ncbi:MAG: lipoprotein [Bacteroidales bacterium]|nr:lipoprotein [Bacteroidales bacterium]
MKKYLFLLFVLVLVSACNCGINSLPKQFSNLADKVEKKGESFSAEQWEQVSDQLDALTEQYNENIDKFNADQKKEINTAIGRIQGCIVKAGLNKAADALNELVDGAKGFLEGLGASGDD